MTSTKFITSRRGEVKYNLRIAKLFTLQQLYEHVFDQEGFGNVMTDINTLERDSAR